MILCRSLNPRAAVCPPIFSNIFFMLGPPRRLSLLWHRDGQLLPCTHSWLLNTGSSRSLSISGGRLWSCVLHYRSDRLAQTLTRYNAEQIHQPVSGALFYASFVLANMVSNGMALCSRLWKLLQVEPTGRCISMHLRRNALIKPWIKYFRRLSTNATVVYGTSSRSLWKHVYRECFSAYSRGQVLTTSQCIS